MRATFDGNHAAAYAAYAFTEVAAVYPITPSSPMAELTDEWSARGKTNMFGRRVRVVELQSEAGAAGAMHGSLQAGALTTTFTASQGLLLMIPSIYKMAGELLPGVLHVSARALSTHALSIFGDHQDVMACRQTGACMLASSNAQEALDLGFVAHLSALSARLPFIHFFDGFRTSHEYRNIECLEYEALSGLFDHDAYEEFRSRSLNPARPLIKGTAQNPDVYFQGREIQNRYHDRAPDIVASYMDRLGEMTGRRYRPFDYYGAADAERMIVAMGSVCDTIRETVDYLNGRGERVGLLQVRLYRPFSVGRFFEAAPRGVRRIAVLDRTKEPGAPGEPLYLDVCRAYYGSPERPLIVGGRYGLGSKDTSPRQILAVYDNLKSERPKNGFTIGITDDVTGASLPESEAYEPPASGIVECLFWGLGSDGTVGANKSACEIIGDNTDMNVQAYFSYDSKKSGGTTVSHLRFGKKAIRSAYLIQRADYLACHNKSFLNGYDFEDHLKPGGIFVLNCDCPPENIGERLPAGLKRFIAKNNVRFYIIDAGKIASDLGLGNRINMIMQAAFFRLTEIMPAEEAARHLKASIHRAYGRKGRKMEEMNCAAVDMGLAAPVKIEAPAEWAALGESEKGKDEGDADEPAFVGRIRRTMARGEGDRLPVSAFLGMEDGGFPPGTTAYEKRGIAPAVPEWRPERCVQCGFCSYVCPHATARLFLLDGEEAERAPGAYATLAALGRGLEGYRLRVQISPLDCTGCGNCVEICPAKDKALIMRPAGEQIDREKGNWEFSLTLREKPDLAEKAGRFTIKGSQLMRPLMEFSGACPGCGETPYVRLLTQLFGERMMIANATGCSSIWGASAPSMAYTTNAEGRGPAWANSLFEDNAEYGYGLLLGAGFKRGELRELARRALEGGLNNPDLERTLRLWLDGFDDGPLSLRLSRDIIALLEKEDVGDKGLLRRIYELRDYIVKPSVWLIGGDGWAYDIGYGGLDHVLSTGEDVNVFVMDTEVYSNTGGQASKATPAGAVAKFAFGGKASGKKDLGLMAMTYGGVYVAQIALGADMGQTLRALREAESYGGPSLVIAYSPCISHGIRAGMASSVLEERKAVETGYWQLYRYDPRRLEAGENPFQLDSKEPVRPYRSFLEGELRFSQLLAAEPERAEKLFGISEKQAARRLGIYRRLSEGRVL